MDAIKFIEERNRMCNSFSPDCEGCRVDEARPVISECFRWILDNPEKAVQIVEEWSATHPRKTRQSVFLEQYPEAELIKDGVISICPMSVSAAYRNKTGGCASPTRPRCADCIRDFWMQEVE